VSQRFAAFSICLAAFLAGCSTVDKDYGPMSSQRVSGPKGYTVDWDLPYTDYYWLPPETENDMVPASRACGATVVGFIYHHMPRPPQYSYSGFRFSPDATDEGKRCVLSRLKAVPALTTYAKKK
jgi:hypothetical protein